MCTEDSVKRMKGEALGREIIFAKHISGKGLLIRMYYKNSFKPTQIKNGQRILKDIFSERRYTNDK